MLQRHARIVDPRAAIVSLAFMHERFQGRLTTLPFLRFRRKTRLVEVGYATGFVYDNHVRLGRSITFASRFQSPVPGVRGGPMIRRRVKRSDDFDLERLDVHLQGRIESLD